MQLLSCKFWVPYCLFLANVSTTVALLTFLSSLGNKEALCCTCTSSCNFRGLYVARASRLATFEGFMLHVNLVLQLSRALCCTCTSSCNFRGLYVARASRLATFEGFMLHVNLVLQLSRALFTQTKSWDFLCLSLNFVCSEKKGSRRITCFNFLIFLIHQYALLKFTTSYK